MKYNLSKDYDLLWKLIQKDFKVAGWVTNHRISEKSNKKFRDIVEIKFNNNQYRIGTRGIGYEDFEQTEKSFKETCNFYELEFILP